MTLEHTATVSPVPARWTGSTKNPPKRVPRPCFWDGKHDGEKTALVRAGRVMGTMDHRPGGWCEAVCTRACSGRGPPERQRRWEGPRPEAESGRPAPMDAPRAQPKSGRIGDRGGRNSAGPGLLRVLVYQADDEAVEQFHLILTHGGGDMIIADSAVVGDENVSATRRHRKEA